MQEVGSRLDESLADYRTKISIIVLFVNASTETERRSAWQVHETKQRFSE